MKHYKNAIIHGAKLFRQLKGLSTASNNELALATLPVANDAAARAWTGRRLGEEAEEGDDFLGALAATLGGGGDAAGDDDFFGGFLGGGGEDGDDLFGGFFGGDGEDGGGESGGDFLSAFMGGGGDAAGDDDFFGGFFGGGGEDGGGDSGGGFLSAFMGGGMGMGGGDESGDDFFGSFLWGGGDDPDSEGDGGFFAEVNEEIGEFMEHFEQCGIDVEDLSEKVLTAFFSLGMTGFESYMDLSFIQPIFLALKDDDEEECSASDEVALFSASEEYLKCAGVNDFFDPTTTPIAIQDVAEDCTPVYNMVSAGDVTVDNLEHDILDEESPMGKSTMRCLKTTLGDSEIGNFLRYEYNNFDKLSECLNDLSTAMPHCVMSFPYQDNKPFSLPLSLWKKAACLFGSTAKSIIEKVCVGIYNELDTCLPQDGEDFDGSAITKCSEEEVIPLGKVEELFGMDASVLTGNDVIPDFCSSVFEEKAMDTGDIESRLDYYNQNREYGWTFESIVTVAKNAVDEITPPDDPVLVQEPQAPVPGDPQESTYAKSNPVGIVDGEAASDKASSQNHFPILVSGLLIIAAATLALIVKYRGARGANSQIYPTSSSNITGKQYPHMAVNAIDAEFA